MSPRGHYIALMWAPDAADAANLGRDLGQRLDMEPDWSRVGQIPGVTLWTPEQGPSVRRSAASDAILVGDYFPHAAAQDPMQATPPGAPRQPEILARQLLGAGWGGYVALLRGAADGMPRILRDPSGRVPALTWALGPGLAVVASDIVRTPAWLRPHRLALDWTRIARFLASPGAVMSDPLFEGVEAIGPGELAAAGHPNQARQLVWSPAGLIAREAGDAAEAARELVRRVDDCTAALVGSHNRVLVEVSGGLDSAIVAGAVGAAGLSPRVVQWLNRVGGRRESDETAYARAVTGRLGAKLTVVAKAADTLDEPGLHALASSFWPTLAGLDLARDADELSRVQATGATAILSGEGGDGAFFQMPTSLIASDALRREGLAFLGSTRLADIARRTRRSVWRVLREATRDLQGHPDFPQVRSPYVTDGAASDASLAHPWVEEVRRAGAPSAKVLQVLAVSATQLVQGASRRASAAELLYPLLAQPVVELCLSIPAATLAGASYDRPFARAAFAERIPDAVRLRHGKGDHSAIYARTVANSFGVLRPHLLEGCLCEAGLLDRAALDAALTPERLIWGEDPGAILWAAAVESWVRYWQARAPDSTRAPRRSG